MTSGQGTLNYRPAKIPITAAVAADKDTNFDKIDQFTRENEAFHENPLVSDFLAAELAFCRMMQEIGLYVTDQMKFE